MQIHEVDDNGRRLLVPLADEQDVLRKIWDMRSDGMKLHQIARRLNEMGSPDSTRRQVASTAPEHRFAAARHRASPLHPANRPAHPPTTRPELQRRVRSSYAPKV